MKISDLVYDLVLEASMSKDTYNFLYNLWSQEKPDITQDEIMSVFEEFNSKKNGLSMEKPNPALYSFLNRFDGSAGFDEFKNRTTDGLRKITSYTYKQIISLLDDYPNSTREQAEITTVFDGKDTSPTKERIDASKALWTNPATAIINKGSFRVYAIESQKMAVSFGYYVEEANAEMSFDVEKYRFWCVGWRPDLGLDNRWSSYRRSGKTFYFIIDDSRDPETDKYYLSALQINTNGFGQNKYVLSPLTNTDDNPKTWEQIIAIHPQLKDSKDIIVPKPFSEKEVEEDSIIGRINETPGPNEFSRQSYQNKKLYIDGLGEITKGNSWKSMYEDLRKKYIVLTTANNWKNRFRTQELISAIRTDSNMYKYLDKHVKTFLKNGVGSIIDEIYKNEFDIRRRSINKPHLRIMESKNNGLCGIHSSKIADWVVFDGVTYEPTFREFITDVYFDDDGFGHFVEAFKNVNNSSELFYAVYPTESEDVSGFIMSSKKWEQLKEDGKFYKQDELDKLKPIDPESDTDIEEMKKGLY